MLENRMASLQLKSFKPSQLLLFLLCTMINHAIECPHECACLDEHHLQVNCSSRLLLKPPKISDSTLTLDLSHNSLGPMLNVSFAQMRDLTLIDLSQNALTLLGHCIFTGMLSLTTVRLRGNRLTSLPDDLFTDANRVQHLDISHNFLTELQDNPFKNLHDLKTLDVSYNLITNLKLGPRFQVPRLIEVFDLSHNHIEAITNETFDVASQWEGGINRFINLAFCRIASIEKGAISKIPHLHDLDLSGNSGISNKMLTDLIFELGSEAGYLDRLSLAYMNLTTITETFFTQTFELSLKYLNLSFNSITDVPARAFSTIRSLRVLDLSRNKVSTLAEGLFDLVNLQVLNMSHNNMESFHGDEIEHLSNLHTLDVSHNRLGDPNVVNFVPLTKLSYLNVNNNLLPSVILPSNTSNLKFLDYHSNRIKVFSGLDESVKLEYVDLSDNDMEVVSGFLFRTARSIKLANFSKNSIETIDNQAFLPQSPLVIDLSYNYMKGIHYTNWVATQKLYLNNNSIVHIDSQAFQRMTDLQELDLSKNELMMLHEDLFHHLTKLKRLNLSHNRLDKLLWSDLFRNLEQLEALDLGHNNISQLREPMLSPLSKIQTLCLKSNQIKIIIPRVFRDITELKEIDLSNNPFDCVCDLLSFKDWLKTTKISVIGMYSVDSTAYLCRSPQSRTGMHVLHWSEEQFECNRYLLYIIIVCSTGAFLILVGVAAVVLFRFYKNWQQQAELKRQLKEAEDERKRQAKKLDIVKLSNQEIAEAINDAIDRRNRNNPWKYGVIDRQGKYITRSGQSQRTAGHDKSRRYSENSEVRKVFAENDRSMQKQRGRSRDKHYENLKMDEWAMEDFGKQHGKVLHESSSRTSERYRDNTENRNDMHSDRRQSDNSSLDPYVYDRRGIPLRTPGNQYEEAPREAQLRGNDRLFHYSSDSQYTRAVGPVRNSGPYIISANTLPKKWHSRDEWKTSQGGIYQGDYRRSRSEDRRMEGYLAMPIGDADIYRLGREARKIEKFSDHNHERFPLYTYSAEEREPMYYTHQQIDNPRHNYYDSQRSQSYILLPQDFVGKTFYLKRGRAQREYERIKQTSVNAEIGPRAVSQPVLATESMPNWL